MHGKIVKIEPVIENFSITWNITSHCNYDCMYCPQELHDNSGKTPSLEELKQYWIDIDTKSKKLNLKHKISFSGGEATTVKNFLPFLQWLKLNYHESIDKILLTSNGSASIRYYKKTFEFVDNLTLTVHSEHIDETKFFDKVTNLKFYADRLGKVLHVDIMNEHWNIDRVPMYEKILKKHNVPYSVNELNYSMGTRSFPIFKGNLNIDENIASQL